MTDIDPAKSEPKPEPEFDTLTDLMFDRLQLPEPELRSLIALAYASDKAHAKAAATVDAWTMRFDYALGVLRQRLRAAMALVAVEPPEES
jgi:hypothetical protein